MNLSIILCALAFAAIAAVATAVIRHRRPR
jgi:hypothetical protein